MLFKVLNFMLSNMDKTNNKMINNAYTAGTAEINDCGDGGSGLDGACRHHETTVRETVKVRRKIGEAQPSSVVA